MWQNIAFVTQTLLLVWMQSIVSLKVKRLNGKRLLIVTGPSVKSAGILDRVLEPIKNEKTRLYDVNILQRSTTEPTTDLAETVAKIISDGGFDVVWG
ncbi:hypothetical protein MASR2M17_21120 [Aminivibrio sp.]